MLSPLSFVFALNLALIVGSSLVTTIDVEATHGIARYYSIGPFKTLNIELSSNIPVRPRLRQLQSHYLSP